MNDLLERLCQFIGYGSRSAGVIFIGKEESTYDRNPQDYEQRLNIQSQLSAYTDLRKLCDTLDQFPNLYNPQKHPPQPQPTWSPLCSVMLGISGCPISQIGEGSAVLDYQRSQLGKINGDSLLAELFPAPKSSVNSFNELHSRLLGIDYTEHIEPLAAYHASVLTKRQNLIAEMILARFTKDQESHPRLILAYGRPWSLFEAIFQKIGRMQYTSDPAGRFKWAEWNGCLFVLTWHPVARDKWASMKFGLPVAKNVVEIYRARSGMRANRNIIATG